MLDDIRKHMVDHMDKSIAVLKKDLNNLRSGKVSLNILEGVRLKYYDNEVGLREIANVLIKNATTITISPWEKHLIKDIEKAILEANLGVTPNVLSNEVVLNFPPMTKEQRQIIAKEVKVLGEKAKVAIRNIRQDANTQIKKLEKDKGISNDESKRATEEVQKVTDGFIKSIDEITKAKENEVLTI